MGVSKNGWRPIDDDAKSIDRSNSESQYGKRILGLDRHGDVYTCNWWQSVDDPDCCNFLCDGHYAVHLKAWQPLPEDDFS